MTLKKYPPIRELLAALPPGTLSDGDNAILKTLSASMAALREPDFETNVFTVELRGSILTRLKACVAEVLDPHVPKAGRGRPADPLKVRVAAFTATFKAFVALIDLSWRLTPDERAAIYAVPRAALDKAYAALRATAAPNPTVTAAWTRLCASLDGYTTYVFTGTAAPFGKTEAAVEMLAALKTLTRV